MRLSKAMRNAVFGLAFCAVLIGCGERASTSEVPSSDASRIEVLDGDTLVVEGEVVRLADVDAPELAPNAQCWAEAALAGHAKSAVEGYLHEVRRSWRVTQPRGRDPNGHLIASLTRNDGEDLADLLVVYGHAARSTEWDWCGEVGDMRANEGPNLWYPPDERIDVRAHD
jgi:endonuclease YncB( thermonuclease family)